MYAPKTELTPEGGDVEEGSGDEEQGEEEDEGLHPWLSLGLAVADMEGRKPGPASPPGLGEGGKKVWER